MVRDNLVVSDFVRKSSYLSQLPLSLTTDAAARSNGVAFLLRCHPARSILPKPPLLRRPRPPFSQRVLQASICPLRLVYSPLYPLATL